MGGQRTEPDLESAFAGFPELLQHDAARVASELLPYTSPPTTTYEVRVGLGTVAIPYRIDTCEPAAAVFENHDLKLQLMMHCMLTRHHDGWTQRRHLAPLLFSKNAQHRVGD